MNPKDQELMKRYIYQVVRRLPKEQRHEIMLELEEMISDMREHAESMEEVLTKLGDPREFAKKYQDGHHYLIGPEYFDHYLWFLKTVLTCAGVTILMISVLESIRDGIGLVGDNMVQAVIYGITNCIVNLFAACIGIFGGITLLFAVMERRQVKFELKREKEWSIHDLEDSISTGGKVWTTKELPPIPSKKAIISRGDSIAGIVFIVIFCVLLIFAPNFFGVILKSGDGVSIVPIFNLDQWHVILPVFILALLIGLGDEVFRLLVGHYCKPVMISNIVCGTLQIMLSFIVLKAFPFWNPDFEMELKIHLEEQVSSSAEFFIDKWDGNFVSNCLLAFCVVVTLLEIGTTIYKTLLHGTETMEP